MSGVAANQSAFLVDTYGTAADGKTDTEITEIVMKNFDLRAGAIVRLELDDDKIVHEERLIRQIGDRIRDIAVGPDGAVYAITDSANGKILRITPAL